MAFPPYPCRRVRPDPSSRRDFLRQASCGFGGMAAAALLHQEAARAASQPAVAVPHHPPRATSVIFLYMDGGVSQVDAFDPKPRLEADAGKNPRDLFKVDATTIPYRISVLHTGEYK